MLQCCLSWNLMCGAAWLLVSVAGSGRRRLLLGAVEVLHCSYTLLAAPATPPARAPPHRCTATSSTWWSTVLSGVRISRLGWGTALGGSQAPWSPRQTPSCCQEGRLCCLLSGSQLPERCCPVVCASVPALPRGQGGSREQAVEGGKEDRGPRSARRRVVLTYLCPCCL